MISMDIAAEPANVRLDHATVSNFLRRNGRFAKSRRISWVWRNKCGGRKNGEKLRRAGYIGLMKHRADWSPSADIRVLAVDGEDGRWLVSGQSSAACACPTCEQPSRGVAKTWSNRLEV